MPPGIPKTLEIIARGLAARDGRVLLCRSRKHDYTYLPGGHVEPGELAAEALAREFLEETGLRVRVGGFLLAHENLFEQRGKPRHEYSLLFHVEHAEGPWPDEAPSLEGKISFEWDEVAAQTAMGLVPPAMFAWLTSGGQDNPNQPRWVSQRQDA